ncbi:hypothetical protein Tco_0570432 [Tanacetum coccineum]
MGFARDMTCITLAFSRVLIISLLRICCYLHSSYTDLSPAEPSREPMMRRTVTESDPEEDLEEYEDDEIEDGPADYPIDGGDDGDDDDGDSSRDDANDEDEDDDEEEEEEHLAPADSTIVIPVDEPVFPPEGTEPVIPPPTLTYYWGYGSLLLSFSAAVSITSTTPLTPISIYMTTPVDRRIDSIPSREQPPRHDGSVCNRYRLQILMSGESSTARSAERVPEIEPMTVGEFNTRVSQSLLKTHKRVSSGLYALLEVLRIVGESKDGGGGGHASERAWAHLIGLSQGLNQELQTHHDQVYASRNPFSGTRQNTATAAELLSFRTASGTWMLSDAADGV